MPTNIRPRRGKKVRANAALIGLEKHRWSFVSRAGLPPRRIARKAVTTAAEGARRFIVKGFGGEG